jgi:hypothetical protein
MAETAPPRWGAASTVLPIAFGCCVLPKQAVSDASPALRRE